VVGTLVREPEIGMISKYLLDELMAYENGFGDMISPERRDYRHTVFMGILDSDRPASVGTVRELKEAVEARIKPLEDRLERVEGALAILPQITNSILLLQQELTLQRGVIAQLPYDQSRPALLQSTPAPASPLQQPSSSYHPAAHPFVHSAAIFASILHQPQQLPPPHPPQQHQTQPAPDQPPPSIPKVRSFRDVIQQWYLGDKEGSLLIPFQYWIKPMRSGRISSKYSQRWTVIKEYECHMKSEREMRGI
jgi:hypothetical protein